MDCFKYPKYEEARKQVPFTLDEKGINRFNELVDMLNEQIVALEQMKKDYSAKTNKAEYLVDYEITELPEYRELFTKHSDCYNEMRTLIENNAGLFAENTEEYGEVEI